MSITIIGTAGIPSKYGGFETLTEYITKFLGEKLDITVYCSSKIYEEKKAQHNKAHLKYINLDANGIQSIPYDILSLFHASRNQDHILILGVSGCIILPLFRMFYPKKKLIINIDGLEHRREKWNKGIQKFLKLSERFAVKYGNHIIADNKAIQDYIASEYNTRSELIAYGGDHSKAIDLSDKTRAQYGIPAHYAFKVCRIEPENNIHVILDAFTSSDLPIVLIGNWQKSDYGLKLKEQFSKYSSILLLDPIYDQQVLDEIRSNCSIYVHGHSAGGTNPSLVEAMNLGLPIIAYDVSYNRETTFNKAAYFKSAEELQELIKQLNKNDLQNIASEMKRIAQEQYTWAKISDQYYKLISSN